MSNKKTSKKSNVKFEKQILPQQESSISKNGKIIISLSMIGLIVGFFLLKFTDPEGSNWASILSPIFIITSYIFIAVGIIVK
jgi:hypothetical protein